MTAGQAGRGATGRAPARAGQQASRSATSPPAARRTQAAKRAAASGAQAPRTAAKPARPAGGATARSAAQPAQPAQRAAAQAIGKESGSIGLPWGIGPVRVPSPDRMAFYGGIAALALLGVVDWPVALVIGIGHVLADDRRHRLLADFGEALGEA
jgi:hypothetical protein